MRPLSGDRPGHPVAAGLIVLLLVALLALPFVLPGARAMGTGSRIAVFVVLAASYDILLGYTGIVSFAHTMYLAIGAYAVAIPLSRGFDGWTAIALGAAGGTLLAAAISAAIALLSLRVRAIFFSMVTLAAASLAQLLASQMRDLTGGEDGITFALPSPLTPAFRLFADPVLGVRIDGRVIVYYLILTVSLALFLAMLRIVNSPFGHVLQAIRENAFRAEALGYRVVSYRTLASALAGGFAALAGVLLAIQLRYVGPETTLSFDLMLDILLMVVIGGMGTLFGPALGAALIVLSQTYLQQGLQSVPQAWRDVPVLGALLAPERWLLWLGVLFVAIVYAFPAGIVGTLRQRRHR